MKHNGRCRHCKGTGMEMGWHVDDSTPCPVCDGSGCCSHDPCEVISPKFVRD